MSLVIALGIFAIVLFYMFKFNIIGTQLLGKEFAKHNGLKGNNRGGVVSCTHCGKDVRQGETVAYCERCRKYL